MKPLGILARTLDVRPGEARPVMVSFIGAFCVISILILGRALREAMYLDRFDVTTLPYITVAVVVASIPTVTVFSNYLAEHSADRVFRALMLVVSAGLLVLWPLAAGSGVAVVVFYLWTALGALLLTSSFWVVTSDRFQLREAKRLFGLISGGGTLGAMVTGTSLNWLGRWVDAPTLILGLVALLMLLFGVQWLLPEPDPEAAEEAGTEEEVSLRRGPSAIWSSRHLRTLAAIVFAASVASAMLDYQFKEVAKATYESREQLLGFFGVFYGWAGVLALIVQIVLASGLTAAAGVGVTLSVLPTVLLLGSGAYFVFPGFAVVTAVRGADYSLRKSLHRMVIEYLYVPMPSRLRRRTKAFIDSVVDSVAEGCGAAVVFFWVTLAGFSSRYLSIGVMLVAGAFMGLAFRMGRQYLSTLQDRLRESGDSIDDPLVETRFDGHDLLTVTMTQFDLREQLRQAGIDPDESLGDGGGNDRGGGAADGERTGDGPSTTVERLRSSDPMEVSDALDDNDEWGDEHVDALVRLIPRSTFYDRAADALREIGAPATERLLELLGSEAADFVIRRRIPKIVTPVDGEDVNEALIDALSAGRFEVRYRSAISLVRRRESERFDPDEEAREAIWSAIETEVGRDRPIWELQKLLDGSEAGTDDFVTERVGVRGELSLEHTFRLLSLVLEPDLVRTAFHGIVLDDDRVKSISLEYLEHVLPEEIRERLWPFIGDVSEYQREKSARPVDEVASDLLKTGVTLFGSDQEKEALRRALDDRRSGGDE